MHEKRVGSKLKADVFAAVIAGARSLSLSFVERIETIAARRRNVKVPSGRTEVSLAELFCRAAASNKEEDEAARGRLSRVSLLGDDRRLSHDR